MKKFLMTLRKNLSPSLILMFAAGLMLFYMARSIENNQESRNTIGNSSIVSTKEVMSTSLRGLNEEEKLQQIIGNISDVGKCQVMMSQDKAGVCIVCEGADKPEVAKEIRNIVMALYDMEPHRIIIVKIKGDV